MYERMIKDKIIEDNKIYDLNDKKTMQKLNKYKKKINSVLLYKVTEDLLIERNMNHYKIEQLLMSDTILNKEYYVDYNSEHYTKDDISIYIDNLYGRLSIEHGYYSIRKINKRYIDYQYLRNYLPYLRNGINEVYMQNRNYENINFTLFSLQEPDSTEIGRFGDYYFNDGNPPWNSENFNAYIKKFIENTKNMTRINISQETYGLIYQNITMF